MIETKSLSHLNDWLIWISDFFKYCVHGIHEKQVLVRLVVDSFAFVEGSFVYLNLFIHLINFTVFE